MKPKILMLGWEFPPVVSGGLGQATLGLSQALAQMTEVTMIVPKADEVRFSPPSKIVSLHHLSAESINREIGHLPFLSKVAPHIKAASPYAFPYDTHLLAYPEHVGISGEAFKKAMGSSAKANLSILQQITDVAILGNIDEGYGENLLQQIILYSKLAVEQALQHSFDIIHAHDWLTFIAAIELKRLTGKPLVLHIHALEYDRIGPNSRSWIYELEKMAMEEADLIIPVSSYTGNVINFRYGIDADKIVPIHNGIESIEPYKKTKGFSEKLIVFMGRMASQKGPEVFLKLARELLHSSDSLRFVMAGEGEMKRQIMEEVARFRLGDRIHFTGFLERQEVYELLAMTDILVMPSRSEPFGLVALEAAAFGVPVIISQYAGVAEVLTNAPKIEPSEILQIKGYVNRLLNDDNYRERLGNQLQLDAKNCTWEKTAQKVLEQYEKLR